MASGFFAILDDIAALMDDIAVTSKIATKQTAGILGDDLAVNAEKAHTDAYTGPRYTLRLLKRFPRSFPHPIHGPYDGGAVPHQL